MSVFRLGISAKLPIGFVVLSLLTAVITAVVAFMRADSAMESAAFDKLKAVQQSRLSELNSYLDSIKIDVSLLAENDMIIDGLEELEKGWDELGAAGELSQQSEMLRAEVDKFVTMIRNA